MIHCAKDIFESKELKEVRGLDAKVREYLKKRCLPSHYKGGMYLIPVALIMEVDEQLATFECQRKELVKVFIAAYPGLIEDAAVRLKDQFNFEDYPPVERIEGSFGLSYKYVAFDTPVVLNSIKVELFEREQRKAEMQLKSQAAIIQSALRVQFAELVGAMELALTPTDDGKKRRFNESTMKNWAEFCNYFEARNLTGDMELAALVEKSKVIMGNTSATYIRESDIVRDHIRDGVKSIADKLSELVEEEGRMFDFGFNNEE